MCDKTRIRIPHVTHLVGLLLGGVIFGCIADYGGRKMVLLGEFRLRLRSARHVLSDRRFNVDSVHSVCISITQRRLHLVRVLHAVSRYHHRCRPSHCRALCDRNGTLTLRTVHSSIFHALFSFRLNLVRSTFYCSWGLPLCSIWFFHCSRYSSRTGRSCKRSFHFHWSSPLLSFGKAQANGMSVSHRALSVWSGSPKNRCSGTHLNEITSQRWCR